MINSMHDTFIERGLMKFVRCACKEGREWGRREEGRKLFKEDFYRFNITIINIEQRQPEDC